MSKDDFAKITALAKEGITSRGEVKQLSDSVEYYRNRYYCFGESPWEAPWQTNKKSPQRLWKSRKGLGTQGNSTLKSP